MWASSPPLRAVWGPAACDPVTDVQQLPPEARSKFMTLELVFNHNKMKIWQIQTLIHVTTLSRVSFVFLCLRW